MGLLDLLSGAGPKGLRKPKSIRHGGKRLSEILDAHAKFHRGQPGGARADLTDADLRFADFSQADLPGAILVRANLEGANFKQAKLTRADLSGANLRGADLRNTDMTEAVLPGANLTEAQASGIELFRCDLSRSLPGARESAKHEFPRHEYQGRALRRRRYGRDHSSGDRPGRRGPFRRGSDYDADAARLQACSSPSHEIEQKCREGRGCASSEQIDSTCRRCARRGRMRLRLELRRRVSMPSRLIFWLSVDSGI